jgi:hypothetical protein
MPGAICQSTRRSQRAPRAICKLAILLLSLASCGPDSAMLVARVNGGVMCVIARAPLEPGVPAWRPITEAY